MSDEEHDPEMTRRDAMAAGAAVSTLSFLDGGLGFFDTHEVVNEENGEVVENFGVDPEVLAFAEGLSVERRDDGGVSVSWDPAEAGAAPELDQWREDEGGQLRGPRMETPSARVNDLAGETLDYESANIEKVQNTLTTTSSDEVSHTRYVGPDDPTTVSEFDVEDGDVWVDTS